MIYFLIFQLCNSHCLKSRGRAVQLPSWMIHAAATAVSAAVAAAAVTAAAGASAGAGCASVTNGSAVAT